MTKFSILLARSWREVNSPRRSGCERIRAGSRPDVDVGVERGLVPADGVGREVGTDVVEAVDGAELRQRGVHESLNRGVVCEVELHRQRRAAGLFDVLLGCLCTLRLMSPPTTFAPSFASRRAVSAPIPVAPPAITLVLPDSPRTSRSIARSSGWCCDDGVVVLPPADVDSAALRRRNVAAGRRGLEGTGGRSCCEGGERLVDELDEVEFAIRGGPVVERDVEAVQRGGRFDRHR